MVPPTYHFPSTFGIYQTSPKDLILAQKKEDPNPLHLFRTHKDNAQTPHYALHSSASPDSPAVATGLATGTDPFYPELIIMNVVKHRLAAYSGIPPKTETQLHPKLYTMHMRTNLKTRREFTYTLSGESAPMVFRWKSSSCKEIRDLGGSGSGLKLVKVASGEVVAGWSRPRGGAFSHKKGRMGFVGKRLGEEFDLLVVMSLLVVVECGLQN